MVVDSLMREGGDAIARSLHIANFLILTNAPLIGQVVSGEAGCQEIADPIARLGEEPDGLQIPR